MKSYHPAGASHRLYVRKQVRKASANGAKPYSDARGQSCLDLYIKGKCQHVVCGKRDIP